jgi:hypothetical protein
MTDAFRSSAATHTLAHTHTLASKLITTLFPPTRGHHWQAPAVGRGSPSTDTQGFRAPAMAAGPSAAAAITQGTMACSRKLRALSATAWAPSRIRRLTATGGLPPSALLSL